MMPWVENFNAKSPSLLIDFEVNEGLIRWKEKDVVLRRCREVNDAFREKIKFHVTFVNDFEVSKGFDTLKGEKLCSVYVGVRKG